MPHGEDSFANLATFSGHGAGGKTLAFSENGLLHDGLHMSSCFHSVLLVDEVHWIKHVGLNDVLSSGVKHHLRSETSQPIGPVVEADPSSLLHSTSSTSQQADLARGMTPRSDTGPAVPPGSSWT